ncbi:hypothetical protein BBJ28_00025216 [Nothophytophthora sp. Chile5]|nr:hypothetical protein BBJ28_00025216 [Nothophytophthora sp. Chile5]
MTLFSNMEALSFDVLVHVFDRFLLKGWKQLFRVSLAILEELQGPILASSFDEIPRLFYDIQEYAVRSLFLSTAPQLLTPEYVLTQAAKHKVTNRLLERLQSEFEQQTATSSTSSKRLSVRTTQTLLPTNQRSLKSVATSPASSPGPEAPPRPKSSSATREASPSRVHPSAAVQWTPDRSPATTKG